MKKIFSLLICLFYFSSAVFAYSNDTYDFSDEAQAEFDRAKQQQIIVLPTNYSDTYNNQTNENIDRTNYYPKNSNHSRTKNKKNKKNLLYDEETQQAIEQPVEENTAPNTHNMQPVQLQQYPSNDKLYGHVVQIPAGTQFDVTFDSGISSGSMAKDDRLTVRLTNDLTYNGQIIAPAGSLVYGVTTDATNAGYAYGSGAIEINFNQILTPDGNMLPIATRTIVLRAKSQRAAKMTRDVVVGALGSMLIGAAFTALSGSSDWGKSMAIYGGIGALGGGVRGAMQRGEEIQIPDGTTITVTLTETLNAAPVSIEW